MLEVKNQQTKSQLTIDSQVHNARKELVQTQNAFSVEMLTPELFHSKLGISWGFGLSTAALQFCVCISYGVC